MSIALTQQLTTALAQFSSTTRLYALTIGEGRADRRSVELLVEAFAAHDAVQEIGARDVIFLSTSAYLKLEELLGQQAALEVSLADGTRTRFAGDVSEAAMLGCDGGFARYRVRISPWMWRLSQVRNSRVWQDKSVRQIIDSVFESYLPLAKWRWSSEADSFMQGALPRSYCCQYRESDLDFVRRILTDEGLSWRFEQTEDGPGAVLFADSTYPGAMPEDASSAADGGIRYHGVSPGERQDTVQALIATRRLHATLETVLSADYKTGSVSASRPSLLKHGRNLPTLESYDTPGQYAYANSEQARRYADLQMQAKEARSLQWRGRSTVRTLRAGTRLTVTGTPLKRLGDAAAFAITSVTSAGVNNLPPPAQHALAELFGPIPELLHETLCGNEPEDIGLVIAQATESGYANCFEAIRRMRHGARNSPVLMAAATRNPRHSARRAQL